MSKTLFLSKPYYNLDGDVEQTVGIILAAREQEQHPLTIAHHAMVWSQDWISTWILSFVSQFNAVHPVFTACHLGLVFAAAVDIMILANTRRVYSV
jgi:hypothetical protein